MSFPPGLSLAIDEFLAFSFGLAGRPAAGELLFSPHGWYVERHPGKLMLLEIDGGGVALGSESILRLPCVQGRGLMALLETLAPLKPEFDDTDRYFPSAFPAEKTEATALGPEHAEDLEEMYALCTAEERENVEVELGSDQAWGLFREGELLGFSRYYGLPPSRKIVDLGVIVRLDQRGKGIARSLIVLAAEHARSRGLFPRYRTNAENKATIAVADALGFKPAYRWRMYDQAQLPGSGV